MELSSARMAAHFQKALSVEEDAEKRLAANLKENAALVRTTAGLPHKTRHPIMVPFGRLAFFAGELVHSNELLVHLGDQLYAERSARQAGEILERRTGVTQSSLEAVRERVAGLQERLEVAQRLAEADRGDFLEIREEYKDDGAAVEAAPGRQQAGTAEAGTVLAASGEPGDLRRGSADGDAEFEELMGRLEELEAAEARAAQGAAEAGDDTEMGHDKEDTGDAIVKRGGETESKAEPGRSVAAGSRVAPGVGSKQKRVRFAEDNEEQGVKQTGPPSEGPSAVRRDASVAGAGTALGKGAERARPILGQVVERATSGAVGEDGPGRSAEVGSADDTDSDAQERTNEGPGAAASRDDSGDGSSGSEGIGEDEQEADRRFFEELAAVEEGGSSEDEWAEDEEGGRSGDEGDDDDNEGGPSFETGRQVSADIQQWLARRAPAGPAQEGGRALTSAYARDMALEDARTRLRQRAEQVRRQQGQGLGHDGSTRGDEGSEERTRLESPPGRGGRPTDGDRRRGAGLPEPVRETPQRPAHKSEHQFASLHEKEAAFQRFLSEDFAPEVAGPPGGLGKMEARPDRNTAPVGRIVEKQEPPGTVTSLATFEEPVAPSQQEKPLSWFKREMQRRAGGV
ncbi:prefoldin chaperone subunit family protein [Klebsormidium nitens]|uniref:Prefoldin chaperone subunit family protein n=1 Tax=Klebsormidium nitens TaxID=105231 RepID=A0A1Y1HL62_KLENI|nr:prefoldin chaperone subunit family protein [Klebsormidium nitens]|eukprot:GAQ79350.1 prefoldin chaperone subunit family protein [Klebsormidium nitens]